MCLGIPGQVVEIVDAAAGLALVDVSGVRRTVSVRLLDGAVGPGEWVLVHVGFALARIDAAEAEATLAAIRRLGGSSAESPGDSAGDAPGTEPGEPA